METEKCYPFLSLTYVCICQKCQKYWTLCDGSTAMCFQWYCATDVTANSMKLS